MADYDWSSCMLYGEVRGVMFMKKQKFNNSWHFVYTACVLIACAVSNTLTKRISSYQQRTSGIQEGRSCGLDDRAMFAGYKWVRLNLHSLPEASQFEEYIR